MIHDTENIIWCDDPRLGPITNPIATEFEHGEECGSSSAFWSEPDKMLISGGSQIEGFALAGIQETYQHNLGYGILRTVVEDDRWVLDRFEYIGPSSGFLPLDMAVTENKTVVVGRSLNTAWIEVSNSPILGLALSGAHLGAATVVTSGLRSSGRFLDDNTSVFEADIEWLAAKGITRGCNPSAGNTMFCPNNVVTRGQMAAFLVRALGLADRLNNPFVDDDDSVFQADIERLAAAGITRGCNPPDNDRFCPDGKVTRGQMAAFLVRALGYTDDGGGNLFTDDDASIFESDIDRMGTAGVTRGCNPPVNDKYCPDNVVTRGQMAAFLHRALG